MHNEQIVRREIELLLADLTAIPCRAAVVAEHTAGGAPSANCGQHWPDPAELVADVPLPTVGEAMRHLANIAVDSDRDAGECCVGACIEAGLYSLPELQEGVPTRSIDDVCVKFDRF